MASQTVLMRKKNKSGILRKQLVHSNLIQCGSQKYEFGLFFHFLPDDMESRKRVASKANKDALYKTGFYKQRVTLTVQSQL